MSPFFLSLYERFCTLAPSLKELEQFIDSSDQILSLKFEWDDFGALLKILTVLKSIGERESSIESLFPSLKKIIYMLLQYNVRVPRKCSIQVGFSFICALIGWLCAFRSVFFIFFGRKMTGHAHKSELLQSQADDAWNRSYFHLN